MPWHGRVSKQCERSRVDIIGLGNGVWKGRRGGRPGGGGVGAGPRGAKGAGETAAGPRGSLVKQS